MHARAHKRELLRGVWGEEEFPGGPRPAFLSSSSSSSFGFSFPTKEENAGSERARVFALTESFLFAWNYLLSTHMSKKRRRREKVEVPTTSEQGNSEGYETKSLWKIVPDHPDIFDTHIVTKLNGNDVKFFYDVNRESRAAIKRSGVRLRDAFKIGDFDTKSTISWALEKCSDDEKKRFCVEMAEKGNLDLLTFLHEERCPWHEETCRVAADLGHFECLKYAHENGCPWDANTFLCAAYNGQLECLQYAHENGCPWDEDTCSYVARYGVLESLKYLHENGCPWDENTCTKAAENGHLECLKYAHENGCPWDEFTCSGAAIEGHALNHSDLECLKYLHENGCPWDWKTCAYAANHGHLECLKYLHDNGCPGSESYAHHLQ